MSVWFAHCVFALSSTNKTYGCKIRTFNLKERLLVRQFARGVCSSTQLDIKYILKTLNTLLVLYGPDKTAGGKVSGIVTSCPGMELSGVSGCAPALRANVIVIP